MLQVFKNKFAIIQATTDELQEFTITVSDACENDWKVVNCETVSDTTGKMFFVAYLMQE